MDLYMSALRQLYPPFPTAATLACQSDEYRGSWSKLFRIAAALMALSPPTAVYAQHASDDPLATADDAFGLTLGLESIGLYGRGAKPEYPGEESI